MYFPSGRMDYSGAELRKILSVDIVISNNTIIFKQYDTSARQNAHLNHTQPENCLLQHTNNSDYNLNNHDNHYVRKFRQKP